MVRVKVPRSYIDTIAQLLPFLLSQVYTSTRLGVSVYCLCLLKHHCTALAMADSCLVVTTYINVLRHLEEFQGFSIFV